jgi:hypothetical protein
MGEIDMKKKPSSQSWWLPVLMAGGCTFLAIGAVTLPQISSGQSPGEKISASAIQIEAVESDDAALPLEFRVAIYEDLVKEVGKSGKFQQVYRSGDRRAVGVPDLLTLHTRVVGFKHGSAKKREVTTVAGATIIKTDVQLVARDRRTLMDRQVEGKVRLFGGNLNATRDLAKKVAKLIRQTADRHGMSAPGT